MLNTIISTILAASIAFSGPISSGGGQMSGQMEQTRVLASEEMDLSVRYPVESVNQGFRENILIAVGYFNSEANSSGVLVINPGEVFAFHNQILPEFKDSKIITQKSGFLAKDGYKYVAGLSGNGVCHLASLMNMVATEAGLEVTALTNHDFANIPGVERKYGTSIKYYPGGGSATERQNLYIKNTFSYPIGFSFSQEGNMLKFSISLAS